MAKAANRCIIGPALIQYTGSWLLPLGLRLQYIQGHIHL